jgi:thiamine-monophosphate kinase
MSEFDFIHRLKSLMTPQTALYPDSVGLSDDVCVLGVIENQKLIASTDSLCENVHFFATDPLDLVVKKAIRTNISDIASKGATPYGMLFNICLPKRYHNNTSQGLIYKALQDDLKLYNIPLLGGDTTSSSILHISITIFGLCKYNIPYRKNVHLHDNIYVTGTLGLSKIGLDLRNHVAQALAIKTDTKIYKQAYLLPNPPVSAGIALGTYMNASMDISDGLLGDLQKMVDSNHQSLGFTLDNTKIPIADIENRDYALECALNGGDDYQILFTSSENPETLFKIASNHNIKLSQIGVIDTNKKKYVSFSHF